MKPRNQKGQALIELIIFLPLMFLVYSLVAGFASAINGSINQQKITRAYFYYRIQNNSTIPIPERDMSVSKTGMFFIGWREKFAQGDNPVMTCYKISLPLGQTDDKSCDEAYEENSTQFIRIGTVYGVCGGTYVKEETSYVLSPNYLRNAQTFTQVTNRDSCLIY